MFLSGIEQVAYDKGIAIGEKKGEERGEKKLVKVYNRLIKDGFTKEQAYKYVYGEDPQEKAD